MLGSSQRLGVSALRAVAGHDRRLGQRSHLTGTQPGNQGARLLVGRHGYLSKENSPSLWVGGESRGRTDRDAVSPDCDRGNTRLTGAAQKGRASSLPTASIWGAA